MSDAPVIRVEHLTKEYFLHQERSNWRATIPGRWGEPRRSELFRALDDVSFEIEPGEAVGIIGSNGAGKSTLLKALAGVVTPTSGVVERPRHMVSIIELGLGFDPDLTGLENLSFAGALLGLSETEIIERSDEIIQFAELEAFADMPVKRYSTGMMSRLGFSLATSVPAEVYLVDEVLSVGDWGFQRKSLERMRSLHAGGAALVLVSHNLWVLSQICERSVLLDHGRVAGFGATNLVLAQYLGQTPYLNASTAGEAPGTPETPETPEGQEVAEEPEGAAGLKALAAVADPGADDDESRPSASVEPLSDEVFFGALTQNPAMPDALRPLVITDLHLDPPSIPPGGSTALIGEIEVRRAIPGARLVVGAYWEGFAGFSAPDELPSALLQEVGTHRFRVDYPVIPSCPAQVTFQLAVVNEEEPEDPEQLLPNAIETARVDLRVQGEVTARPGIWLPRTFTGGDVVDTVHRPVGAVQEPAEVRR